MNICYIIDFFIPYYQGGGERRLYEIAKRLVQKGHQIDILCFKFKKAPLRERIDGINVYHIGTTIKNPPYRSFLDFLFFILHISIWLSKHKYDIIDTQPFAPLLPASLFYISKKHENVIATIHDVSQNKENQWIYYGNIAQYLEKFLYKLPFEKIITVSEAIKRILIENYSLKKEKIQVIYNGVDLKLVDSISDVPVCKNTIIYVGRLIPHKNVEDLIKVVYRLKTDFPNIKLKIIGDGPQKDFLINLTRKLGLENHILFLGQLSKYENVIREIKSSEFLVLPSSREGFGMVLAEANACYKPVIAYKTGGVIDVIENNKNGFLIQEKNLDALTDKIYFLLNNKDIAKEMGKYGRNKVERMFTWEMTVNNIEKFYKSLL